MEKIYGILCTDKNINKILFQQKSTFDYFSKKLKKFYIIDLSNFLIFKNSKNFKKNTLSRYMTYIRPKNYSELKKFMNKKELIGFNGLDKSLNYFYILFLLKKIRVKLILMFNLGHIGNSDEDSITLKSTIILLKKKLEFFIYKVFLFIKILPSIDLYFHTDKNVVNTINKSIKFKKNYPFNSTFNFNYIKKAVLISPRFQKFIKKKNNYIAFLDTNFYHSDRILRDNKPSIFEEKKYFKNLKIFLDVISKFMKKKYFICLHPASDIKVYKKYFKNELMEKYASEEKVSNSYITLAHESSLIMDAIRIKKPLLILESQFLGKYIGNRIIKYKKKFKIVSMNIDNDRINTLNRLKKLKIASLVYKKTKDQKISDKKVFINATRI